MKGLGKIGIWIVVLLFQGWSGPMERLTVVVAGVATDGEAAKVERRLATKIEVLFPQRGDRIEIRTDEAGGIRLVKLTALLGEEERRRLLPELKEEYPSMIVLSAGGKKVWQSAPLVTTGGGAVALLELLGVRLRWEWGVLGAIALVGGFWFFSRARKLDRLDSEQRRLDYRQSSIWARLREEGGDA